MKMSVVSALNWLAKFSSVMPVLASSLFLSILRPFSTVSLLRNALDTVCSAYRLVSSSEKPFRLDSACRAVLSRRVLSMR